VAHHSRTRTAASQRPALWSKIASLRRDCLWSSFLAAQRDKSRRRAELRGWLFPGQNPVNPMSARQLNRAEAAAMGPINNGAGLDKISDLVESAKKQGAEVVSGGKVADLGAGNHFEPTRLI